MHELFLFLVLQEGFSEQFLTNYVHIKSYKSIPVTELSIKLISHIIYK